MKLTGHPSHAGEVRYQAGVVATAVNTPQGLGWDVHRESDGLVRHTERLSHVSHWSKFRAQLRRSPVEFPTVGITAAAPHGTLFYPDCSNNNWSNVQDALDFVAQLKPQGFSGMCHKVSEGNYYEDPFWQPVKQACQEAEIPVLGYHYVTTNDGNSQAQTYLANGGLLNSMFDWEANGGNLENYYAVANAFNSNNVKVGVGYCPQWYWNEVGGGDLTQAGALVSSAYPGGSGYASTIYYGAGGDTGEGWNPYGGVIPTCWQFTDQALIAGLSMDCNAFKGTIDQLSQLFSGEPVARIPNQDAIDKPVDEGTQVSELWDQELIRWDMLGGRTPVEALAAIGQALKIPGFAAPNA